MRQSKQLIHRIFCLVWAVLCAWGSALAQPQFAPDNARMRAGEILFQKPKQVVFTFKNRGQSPLVVERVVPSCGCTTAEWTTDSVEPGKSGQISVVYDAKMLGTFYKDVAVYTNASEEPAYLSLEGRVVTELLDYEGDFPIDLGSVRMNTNYIEFDNVNLGDRLAFEFEVVNMEHSPYRPELMHLPDYLTMEAVPEVIAGGKTGRIRVILDSEKLPGLGLNQTRVYLSRYMGDKVSEANEILVSAVLLPSFFGLSKTELAQAPRIQLSADKLDFGDLDGKKKKTLAVTVTNAGQQPLDISAVQVFNQAVSVSLAKRKILPGKTTTLKVTVSREFLQKAKNRPRVLLISNDPAQPLQVINVSVNK